MGRPDGLGDSCGAGGGLLGMGGADKMSHPRCPRLGCNGLLEGGREVLEMGPVLLVRCPLCGWTATRDVLPPGPTLEEIKASEYEAMCAVRRKRLQDQGRTKSPCRVDGCTGQYSPVLSRSGLCRACQKVVNNWRYRQKQSRGVVPPPFIKRANGSYARNKRYRFGSDGPERRQA